MKFTIFLLGALFQQVVEGESSQNDVTFSSQNDVTLSSQNDETFSSQNDVPLSSQNDVTLSSKQQIPFDLVTVDMVDLIWSSLNQTAGNRTYSRTAMCTACSNGFTLLRFAALPFWPNDVRNALLTNPSTYWAALDGVIDDAKECGCLLLATLFWNVFAIPDVFGESLGTVITADPNSASRARAAQDAFITDITSRYSSEPTIAVWETVNEMNLYFDLNLTQQQPCISPPSGTPNMRTQADNVSTQVSLEWQARVANLVRQQDPLKRPISSGHSVMRPDAKWLRDNYANINPPPRTYDTRDEFINASISSASGCDWLSLHLYPGSDCARWGETNTYSTIVAEAGLEAAQSAGLVFHFGEFGDNYQVSPQRNFTKAVLSTLTTWPKTKNWIASVWDWQLLQQTDTFSLFPDRDAAIIADMKAFNSQILL